MSNWNLSDGLEDHFNFEVELKGKKHTYSMRYPSQKELSPIVRGYSVVNKLSEEYEAAKTEKEKKKKEEEIQKASKEVTDAFEGLFTAHGDSMPIEQLLEEIPSNVRTKFDEMIQTELDVNGKK